MSIVRWMLTVIAFPIGGWIASVVLGQVDSALSAAGAALVAGSVVGGVQWAAIGRATTWRWMVGTLVGFAVGSAIAYTVFAGSIDMWDLAITGLLAGAFVGIGQGVALRRGWRTAMAWAALTGAVWAVGWVVSLAVITANASQYIVFGLSGALVVTVVTGIVLRWILGAPRRAVRPHPVPSAAV
ncbi:MAG: hypothetical protein ABWX56_06385 [Mycetocola sp.]